MIARLVGVALDARVAAGSRDPYARALAAGWIAANALAARGINVPVGAPPETPCVVKLSAPDLTSTLAAIAASPCLLDPSDLPRRWVFVLKLLGLPMLDRPWPVALAHGASVVSAQGCPPHLAA